MPTKMLARTIKWPLDAGLLIHGKAAFKRCQPEID